MHKHIDKLVNMLYSNIKKTTKGDLYEKYNLH